MKQCQMKVMARGAGFVLLRLDLEKALADALARELCEGCGLRVVAEEMATYRITYRDTGEEGSARYCDICALTINQGLADNVVAAIMER